MIEQVSETAKAIKEVGVMEMFSAAFLVVAIGIIGFFIWKFGKSIDELLQETRKQNHMLSNIYDGLKPEIQERIKVIANSFFDLAMFRVLGFIKRTKKENHIDQKEETLTKIKKWVANLHSDRKSKFDNFKVGGRTMSAYVNPGWKDTVVEAVKKEVYDEDPNDERTFTNIKNVYDEIKLDYYERLKTL